VRTLLKCVVRPPLMEVHRVFRPMARDDEENSDAAQAVHVREMLPSRALRGRSGAARGGRVLAHVELKVETALAA